MFDIPAFAQGLALGLGVFVCPGPKDLVILRQALLRRPAIELLAVGIGSDALLIVLGLAGISAALQEAPGLERAALWFGVALMILHGGRAAWRSMTGEVSTVSAMAEGRLGGRSELLLVSFFNPVAWLDTVLVIGTTGAAMASAAQPSYVGGAIMASAAWFSMLTFGARYAGRWMTSPQTWRVLDAFVATAMIGVAAYIGGGLV
jgi:L-lysine exporter family protein LysE/ArgO